MNYPKVVYEDKRTGERYVKIKHPSGLDVLIWKMEGFSTVEALFATKYGSVNTRFKTSDSDDYIEVPEGIAHFLEHKLFENEDCDVFDLYAVTGARANAFTSFEQTAYTFSTSGDYKRPLEILLGFVQQPYFTQETVDKEQGIIAQEIKMCNDSPNRKCFFNLLKAMYKNHPVRIDIAGTVESISHINAELLYTCYNTFYNLHNMCLSIAGDVDEDEVLRICDEYLIPAENKHLQSEFTDEPYEVFQKEIRETFKVGVPLFEIGFKANGFKGKELVRMELAGLIILPILFGPVSQVYKEMLQEGLINSTFSHQIFNGEGFFSCICSGESDNPHKVLKKCIEAVENVKKNGLDPKLFEMSKKSTYGSMIKGFNNVENCASLMMGANFENVDVFTWTNELADLTIEDCNKALKTLFDTNNVSISIIDNQ
ncbi:MAG: pitrilysin family protein [Ruminococcus sp.]|nr:pitrilysin family protein [Ruminococcus sp.]